MKRGPKPRTLLNAWKQLLKERVIVDDCWLIVGRVKVGIGYKTIHVAGFNWYVHRLSFVINHRPLSIDELVLHTCDKPNCVNPDHLFAGSHADNVDDKVKKGRHCFGSAHYRSKLTWDDVNEIRLSVGMNLQQLSDKYGVSRGGISQILKYQTWRK